MFGYHHDHHISERIHEWEQGRDVAGLETRQTRLEPYGMFFFSFSLKSTNVYLTMEYEYRTRELETRFDASRVSLIYVSGYRHHHNANANANVDRDWDRRGRGHVSANDETLFRRLYPVCFFLQSNLFLLMTNYKVVTYCVI